MPRYWHDSHAANAISENPSEEELAERDFNLRILADKKPYFMRYIYSSVMKQYNTYIKNTAIKCQIVYRKKVSDMIAACADDLTDEENEFLYYYFKRMPVSINNCVMNKICRRFEEQFDVAIKEKIANSQFDYTILKSGREYTSSQRSAILKLYSQHTRTVKDYYAYVTTRPWHHDDLESHRFKRESMVRSFVEDSLSVCSDGKQLCDIMLDLCYQRDGTKQFVWDVCAEEILQNLLEKHDYMISFPVASEDGDIEYNGNRFTMKTIRSQQWAKSF